MTRPFSIVALWLLGCTAQAQDDRQLLEAIGQVESGMNRAAIGDGGKALGAYQMHPAAWSDGNARLRAEGRTTYSRTAWRDATAQDMVASAYLRWLRSRVQALGAASPSPEVLAVCWRLGASGAARRGYPLTDYAKRVVNLCPPSP